MKYLWSKDMAIFCLFVLFMCLTSYLFQKTLLTNQAFYSTFRDQLSADKINALIENNQSNTWLGYALIPPVYALKFALVSCCILVGCFFLKIKLSFKKAFRICLYAECVFILPLIIKFFYFLYFKTSYTLTDIQYFSPLSLLSIFDYHNLSTFWIYPFQTFSVFEVVYWFALAYFLKLYLSQSFDRMLRVILYGYIPALSIWLLVVMFLSITLNAGAQA